jgi:FkbM family methyltransferase
LKLVRRAAGLPGLRRLTKVKPLLRVSFAMRASLVEERLRFALYELRPKASMAVYTRRGSTIRIALRHHSPDVMVLDEVFSQHEYVFPPAVGEALARLEAPRVVDLGANIGLFGAFVLTTLPGARILSVEVDPGNTAVHEAAIAANPEHDWRLIRGAAGTAPGQASFVLGRFATSRAAESHEQATLVEVIDALPLLDEADFVKIDIEGGEWLILDDARFRAIRADVVVLEFHAHLCPEDDPQSAAQRRLESAGFSVYSGTTKPAFGAGVLWGVRPASPS